MHEFSAPRQVSGPADEMAMAPDVVGRVARDWDEQHVDLRAAAGQIAHAPTSGFTSRVGVAAADFVRAWTEHTGTAAELTEEQADGLRSVVAAWLSTDDRAGAQAFVMQAYLEELR